MRAFSIILFLVVLQASIGFVNNSNVFEYQFVQTPSGCKDYTIENLSDVSEEDISIFDYAKIILDFLLTSFLLFLKIILAIVFIYPTLVSAFGIPSFLSVFLQTGIYVVYVWGIIQFKSGKGTKTME